jgi:hypothetical protein
MQPSCRRHGLTLKIYRQSRRMFGRLWVQALVTGRTWRSRKVTFRLLCFLIPWTMILTTVYHIISKTVSLMSHYLWNSSLIMAEYLQEQKFPVANLNGRWELAIFSFRLKAPQPKSKKPNVSVGVGFRSRSPWITGRQNGSKDGMCNFIFCALLRYLNSHPIHRVWKSWNNK